MRVGFVGGGGGVFICFLNLYIPFLNESLKSNSMKVSSGQVDLLNYRCVFIFVNQAVSSEICFLLRGNTEFKQRMLIMHRDNNYQGRDLATLQKRNICIVSLPAWNSFLSS